MPEFGVVAQALADEAAGLGPLGGELGDAGKRLAASEDAAEQTGAAGACSEFVAKAGTMLSTCGPALDQVTSALAMAAVCYERADQAVIGR